MTRPSAWARCPVRSPCQPVRSRSRRLPCRTSVANGLQVSFSATSEPLCSIGSQSITNNISSATVTLISAGSCTITASQTGSDNYNAASPVSGTFAILPQGSNLQSQTITFAQLHDVQYGSTFSLSASSSSGLTVSFTASGPCSQAATSPESACARSPRRHPQTTPIVPLR